MRLRAYIRTYVRMLAYIRTYRMRVSKAGVSGDPSAGTALDASTGDKLDAPTEEDKGTSEDRDAAQGVPQHVLSVRKLCDACVAWCSEQGMYFRRSVFSGSTNVSNNMLCMWASACMCMCARMSKAAVCGNLEEEKGTSGDCDVAQEVPQHVLPVRKLSDVCMVWCSERGMYFRGSVFSGNAYVSNHMLCLWASACMCTCARMSNSAVRGNLVGTVLEASTSTGDRLEAQAEGEENGISASTSTGDKAQAEEEEDGISQDHEATLLCAGTCACILV